MHPVPLADLAMKINRINSACITVCNPETVKVKGTDDQCMQYVVYGLPVTVVLSN